MRLLALLASASLAHAFTFSPHGLFPRQSDQSGNATQVADNSTQMAADNRTHSIGMPRRLAQLDAQAPCSSSNPCSQGCCNHGGYCGFGPDYCSAANCTGTCDAQAECGPYAPSNQTDCPLNVCCSKFGFCGTTELFCGDGCQNGCDPVNRPSCGGSSATQRYMGYYESWSAQRPCDAFTPAQLNPSRYTHLYYSFALIGSDGSLTTMNDYDTQFYSEFTGLKKQNPNLKTIISVGGWAAGGQVFSDLAADSGKISTFINSALNLMKQYGFDGIDIDWEYPVAPDRGGSPADKENFVSFLEQVKAACGSTYTVTITIPSSYWYMRGFDIANLEKHIDWFNFMSYDIHGTWDGDSPYTRRVVNPHTNLTEISEGLDLLWRNHIDPAKVALGLGFYGRSFTLSDPSCNTPGCPFAGDGGGSGGGNPGKCTQVSGTLSDFEIAGILASDNPQFVYNQQAAVNWMTWDSNQWVSYDDNKTLAQKEEFANGLCLSGQFAWAVDLGGPGSGQTSPDNGSTNGNETGSGDVYVSPDIWSDPNPTIACYPPCTFILPPYPLSTQSTITFPPYTTSLEVAWPTTSIITGSNGQTTTTTTFGRTTESTVLSIPAQTQSTIDVWNWVLNDTAVSTTTYQVTSSILPPPFIITDDPNPQSSPGVSHPVQTRNATVPPSPYSNPYATPTTNNPAQSTSTSSGVPPPFAIFPSVSFTRGPPKSTCIPGSIGCGHKCRIFCDHPCLICPGGLGFNDPNDPDPPPGPPPGTTDDHGGDTGDDPENNDPEDEGDECDPELDDRQGLCDNGGFPLYDPGNGKIDCDYSPAEAQGMMSACQFGAMNNPSSTQDLIDEAKTCCDGTTSKRSIWVRLAEIFRRSGAGSSCMSKTPPKGKAVPARTYTCDGRFPNICANAKSAIENYPASHWDTMIRRTGGSHPTGPIWENKLGSKAPESQKNSPVVGWDLEGCNVEEYPFSSGRLSGVQPVLRLVPKAENTAHGDDYNDFLDQWDIDAGTDDVNDPGRSKEDKITAGRMENLGKPFYIYITPDVPDQSTEWGLTNNAAGNICGKPYGSDFLLTGGPVKNSMQWDPYFKRTGRLRTYRRYFPNKPDPVVQTYPPQYCKVPSPGRMTLVNGAFQLSRADGTVIGKAAPAPDPNNIGFCEPWPPATGTKLKAREDEEALFIASNTTISQPEHDTLEQQKQSLAHPRHAPALRIRDPVVQVEGHLVSRNTSSGVPKTFTSSRRELAVRQTSSGSYLDPNVYAFLDCSNDDYDPCDWGEVCGQGDGSIGAADDPSNDPTNGGGSTTTPPVTSKPSSTSTKPPASTTYSSSSNCKDCVGVVGTPVSCSFVDGCTPTAPTSSPPPPPPPPPPPSTPPAPQQTSSNNKGSGLCASLGDGSAKDNEGHNMCQVAYSRYLDDYLYTQYTSYTYTADDAFNTALSVIFKGLRGLVGQEGCTAYFKCDSDDAYKKGMTGKQIKSAFDNLFANDKVKVCGSSYLDNGCHVTVNGCNDCVDVGVVCSTKAGNCSPDEAANSPSDNDSS